MLGNKDGEVFRLPPAEVIRANNELHDDGLDIEDILKMFNEIDLIRTAVVLHLDGHKKIPQKDIPVYLERMSELKRISELFSDKFSRQKQVLQRSLDGILATLVSQQVRLVPPAAGSTNGN